MNDVDQWVRAGSADSHARARAVYGEMAAVARTGLVYIWCMRLAFLVALGGLVWAAARDEGPRWLLAMQGVLVGWSFFYVINAERSHSEFARHLAWLKCLVTCLDEHERKR